MKRQLLSSLSLAVLLLGAGACSKWKDKADVTQAVWSDDDAGHAYLVQRYQERKINQILETVTERRNFQYQLFVQSPSGGGRVALTDLRSGQVGPDLYYMKSRGYLIFGEVLDTPLHVIRKIDLAGNMQTVASGDAMFGPCGAMDAVPSPDGTRIAVLEHELIPGSYAPPGAPPPDALAECQDIEIRVRFYDADTLALEGSWTWEADGFMEYGWLADGEFYVETVAGSWRVDAAAGPISTGAPTCLEPKTTSSSTSSTGVYIRPTSDPADPIETTSISGLPVFGDCG